MGFVSGWDWGTVLTGSNCTLCLTLPQGHPLEAVIFLYPNPPVTGLH